MAEFPSNEAKPGGHPDARSGAVLRQWMTSLATDAEAALAAAIAYREMSGEGRDQWLRDLRSEVEHVDVPKVAIFAPLLAVEQAPERRELLLGLLGEESEQVQRGSAREGALVGSGSRGERVYVLSTPLYLDFVQVLACSVLDGCFQWVRHDPILTQEKVPQAGMKIDGIPMEIVPLKVALDELAGAVLSHQRSGRSLPEALAVLGELLQTVSP